MLPFWVMQKRDVHPAIDPYSRDKSGFTEQGSIFQKAVPMLMIEHYQRSTTKPPLVLKEHFSKML